ncbi:hypothetical protein CRG98_024682 [Punica granatum]|uniref:Uncharacterized protein n=1 Tax=Punica granatum TaxID=22663 RepID=A0A2I0JG31_PUNGR|nr:hypothetical protein CRG98_024682 [Punica granatum]
MGNDLDPSGRGSLGRGLGHGTHGQVSRERPACKEWLESMWDTIRDPRRVKEASRPNPSEKGRVILDPSGV